MKARSSWQNRSNSTKKRSCAAPTIWCHHQETAVGNRLSADGTWDYSYDDEGNLTKKLNITTGQTWTYGYDHRNQLVEVERRTSDGGALEMHAEYKYDVFNGFLEFYAGGNGKLDYLFYSKP